MLRLLVDSTAAATARRCEHRAGARRRPRVAPTLGVRRAFREATRARCGPSTDDLAARRRELAELGRLAVAFAMREAPAR